MRFLAPILALCASLLATTTPSLAGAQVDVPLEWSGGRTALRVTVDGAEHPVGTDTFVIRGGKILYQTIAADHALYAVISDDTSSAN